MSVPLDQLYNFLDSVSNHSLLIYGWRPHGSKKLQDLKLWKTFPTDWRILKTLPTLIFHDQEPLDYDFSQWTVDQDFYNAVKNWDEFLLLDTPEVQQFYKNLHLKSVIEHSFYDLTLLVHSEKNSHQVEKYAQNNFVPVYYWSHGIIANDWFRFAKHDLALENKSPTPKTFLIYNRAWSGTREYRLKFAEQLIATDLYQNCITSFAEFDGQTNYKDHVFSNSEFELEHKNLEKVLAKNTHDSAASADYNSQDYQNSQIEVVLETLFDDSRLHLTEKALRPIACGQPFILAATPGSLQYLRSYGFKTFSGYIDETYDTIQDPAKRLNAIIQEMQRIDQLCTESKQHLLAGVQKIVKHNQQLFFSDEFHVCLINEFKQNFEQAIKEVKAGPVGNIWRQATDISKKYCSDDDLLQLLQQDCRSINADNLAWANEWINSKL
jgi:hypothetical protein